MSRAILSNPSIPSAASPSASPSPSAEGEGRRRRGRKSSFIATSGCGLRRSQSRACNTNLLLLQLLLLSPTLLLSSSLLALPLLQRLCFGRLQLFFSPASRASWTDLSPSASPQPHLTTGPLPRLRYPSSASRPFCWSFFFFSSAAHDAALRCFIAVCAAICLLGPFAAGVVASC